MDTKKNYFTTGQMRNALIQIEDKMVHSNWMPNIILGINRGGCIPGVYLSHRINTAHEVLDITNGIWLWCGWLWREPSVIGLNFAMTLIYIIGSLKLLI